MFLGFILFIESIIAMDKITGALAVHLSRLLSVVLFLCVSFSVLGAEGEIRFLRNEYSKMVKGRECISMHFYVKVSGLKGEDIKVTAYVESPKGVGVPDCNGKYSTKDGKVCVSKTAKATYKSTKWSDFTLNIPYDEIHALPGKNTYYVEVLLRHKGKVLARTYCKPFYLTGKTKKDPVRKRRKEPASYHIVKKWMENVTRYSFQEKFLYSNGTKVIHYYARCPNCRGTSMCGMCHGTGICNFCNGQGGRYLREQGYWNPCTACNSSGRCQSCQGEKGRCSLCNGKFGKEHPGYVCNSIMTVFPDGRFLTEKVGYEWTTDRWKERHEAKKEGRCSYCGGTGVNPNPTTGQPGHEWIVKYVKSDESCPYCNKFGSHWHERCPRCNVPTHY